MDEDHSGWARRDRVKMPVPEPSLYTHEVLVTLVGYYQTHSTTFKGDLLFMTFRIELIAGT
jgi:hypothetical protein